MRGSPLVQITWLVLAFALTLVPLSSFSRGPLTPSTMGSDAEQERTTVAVSMTAKFSHGLNAFRVLHLGEPIWEVSKPVDAGSYHRQVDLELPREGIDLGFQIDWASREVAGECAAELILEPEALDARSVTVWGTAETYEILTYRW